MKKNMRAVIICSHTVPSNKRRYSFQPSTNDLDHKSLNYRKNGCSQPLNTDMLSNPARATSLPVASRNQKEHGWSPVTSTLQLLTCQRRKLDFVIFVVSFSQRKKKHILAVNE